MARPLKEGLDYFPHDTDAVNDEKLEVLRALYQNDGYAFFFILLERIYRSPKCELIVSEAETLQILARKVAVTEQKFAEMLSTALKWECFDKEAYEKRGVLTSNGVKKRAASVLEKREEMRERYLTGVSTAETREEIPSVKKRKALLVKESIKRDPPLPQWLNSDLWADFLEMRKKKRATPTNKATELLLRELDKLRNAGNDPNEVLRQSIMSNWTGVFPLKEAPHGIGRQHPQEVPGNRPAGAFADLEERTNL